MRSSDIDFVAAAPGTTGNTHVGPRSDALLASTLLVSLSGMCCMIRTA
jgi:hypothetical protein